MKRLQASVVTLLISLNVIAVFLLICEADAETCKEWVAKVVSVQGSVQARKAGETEWRPVKLNDTYCAGDMIRVMELSRADMLLANETILRLDHNTTITFTGLDEEKQTFLVELLKGAAHFFSRIPKRLKVITPFVNAAVEGTEFFVRVEQDNTFMSVFEGQVLASNKVGSLTLTSGQSAFAEADKPPSSRIVIRPRDAVQWSLYYQPVLYYRPTDFQPCFDTDWQGMVRKSLEHYGKADFQKAFDSIAKIPEDIRDPRFFTYRASLLLSVGRVDEAKSDIERALALSPDNSHALALLTIIAVAQNEKGRALSLAKKAVEADPGAASSLIALSYAQQANFDLHGALKSLKDSVKREPDNALAWARLAELLLSFGDLDEALDAAKKAVALNPDLARTQSVSGFAYLTQIKTKESHGAFLKAIELDQADPLPRLGIGLAKIRDGEMETGRREIEIAVSLDPNNSLVRSYLGKAYYEEKRDKHATEQFSMAKKFDPLDPTPYFYEAIQKQSLNRPVEALYDLQKSIELNDNRAVYRSRLLLDSDLAARSASLGRIYSDLGFQQLALVEGWKSVNVDPGNYSAHRSLADSYSVLPRHEVARVSELLQSQLLQPLNITPVQPHLAESNLFILNGAGPGDLSFNEFNPLFNRDRFAVQVNGVEGGNSTWGDEIVFSGVQGKVSFSIGQFHYETNGFRKNNDQEQDIYNVFAQGSLSHKTSIQAELRYTDVEKGDLPLRFDHDNYFSTLRQKEKTGSVRLGLHHAFTPHSDFIASALYKAADYDSDVSPGFTISTDEESYMAEVQHLLRLERINLISGAGYFSADRKDVLRIVPLKFTDTADIHHTNFYVYSQLNYPKTIIWSLGGSVDFFKGGIKDRNQFNPKFGFTWSPLSGTTFRAALFRTVKRTLISSQTIEPTQVAGFNQFFDDDEATKAVCYGVAVDQKFSRELYGGVEFSRRDLEVPYLNLFLEVDEADWRDELGRAYLYWTPLKWLALSAEYQYERIKRGPPPALDYEILRALTHRVPVGISFFHPSGFSARLKVTYVNQEGKFEDIASGEIVSGDDQFFVVDAAVGYRLPKRLGIITVEVRNLFNQHFHYQDTDPKNPVIYPESLILTRFTLAF